jgi:hypothetical protein
METEKSPKAWVVMVRTQRMGNGDPMIVAYIAGFAPQAEAREAVRKHIGAADGDDILGMSPVSEGTANDLKVTPGSVWML